MNIQDEIVRRNLVSLCFELIGKIEYSFQDYEHLLRKKIQLIGDGSGTSHSEVLLHKACANMDGDIPDEIEDMLESDDFADSLEELLSDSEEN